MESHLLMDFLTPLTLRTPDIKALTALRVQAQNINALTSLRVQAPDVRVGREEHQDLDAAELNSILGRMKMVPKRVMHHMMNPIDIAMEILETCLVHS